MDADDVASHMRPLSLGSGWMQIMFILVVVLGIVWVLLVVRASHNVHRIHHLMTALVVFKALTLLSQVTDLIPLSFLSISTRPHWRASRHVAI